MKKQIKVILLACLVLPCLLVLAACGKGSGVNLPAWTKNLPTDRMQMEAFLESKGYTNIQPWNAHSEFTATRTAGTKTYALSAYYSENAEYLTGLFNTETEDWAMCKTMSKNLLALSGITKFKYTSTAMSFTFDGYDYFYAIVGNWFICEVGA